MFENINITETAGQILGIFAMVFNTLSFSFTNPQFTRKTILVASPMMLIYNVFAFSIGGMINEFFSTVSCLIAFVRYGKNNGRRGVLN